jgi:hypothetical protein
LAGVFAAGLMALDAVCPATDADASVSATPAARLIDM